MEKVIMGTRLPAKLWLDEVEDSCMSQIMDLTSLPFAFKHIAIPFLLQSDGSRFQRLTGNFIRYPSLYRVLCVCLNMKQKAQQRENDCCFHPVIFQIILSDYKVTQSLSMHYLAHLLPSILHWGL